MQTVIVCLEGKNVKPMIEHSFISCQIFAIFFPNSIIQKIIFINTYNVKQFSHTLFLYCGWMAKTKGLALTNTSPIYNTKTLYSKTISVKSHVGTNMTTDKLAFSDKDQSCRRTNEGTVFLPRLSS